MKILNIRGTSGSGKSTLARYVMSLGDTEPVMSSAGKVVGYRTEIREVEKPVFTVGRYTTACGGCDTVKTQDQVCDIVRGFSKHGIVVFEGLLISHLFSRYARLSFELGGIDFGFLDTPLDVCIERVQSRRLARGNHKPLDVTNTTQKWNDSRRVFKKFEEAGCRAVWIPWMSGEEWISEWLGDLV